MIIFTGVLRGANTFQENHIQTEHVAINTVSLQLLKYMITLLFIGRAVRMIIELVTCILLRLVYSMFEWIKVCNCCCYAWIHGKRKRQSEAKKVHAIGDENQGKKAKGNQQEDQELNYKIDRPVLYDYDIYCDMMCIYSLSLTFGYLIPLLIPLVMLYVASNLFLTKHLMLILYSKQRQHSNGGPFGAIQIVIICSMLFQPFISLLYINFPAPTLPQFIFIPCSVLFVIVSAIALIVSNAILNKKNVNIIYQDQDIETSTSSFSSLVDKQGSIGNHTNTIELQDIDTSVEEDSSAANNSTTFQHEVLVKYLKRKKVSAQ